VRIRLVGLVLLALAAGVDLGAQTGEPSPGETGTLENARPGLFRLGTFYLTPYLHVGALGIDTNVFYAPTERQTDFIASGGPGLEIVKPFGRASRFRIDGGLDYLYFAKTDSQRRLNGYGTAQLDLEGTKTRFAVEERYESTFSRPNYEVNDRVQQETEGTEALLRRNLGDRLRLKLLGSRRRTRTDSYEYLGTDLGKTLTSDEYAAGGEWQLALSVKTLLVAGAQEHWYSFPNLKSRDGTSTLAYGGFRTDASALIGGWALAGMRWLRLDSGGRRDVVYADVSATWNISAKTKLAGFYTRDADYSSLAMSGPTPTNLGERVEAFVEKFLTGSVYLRLYARQYRLISDGEVVLVPVEEGPVLAVRNDRIREAGGELGYQFRTRVRAGVTVSYTDRVSTIETFGVEGLLAGFTVQYNPPQPTFR
jgi:putative beta-barrel porin BBP2